jgi:SHS2 domain-containing protein
VYRWIEHTGELELSIEAPTEAEVFVDGLGALAELLGEEGGGGHARHEISLAAADRAVLLADWLEELVFLAETEDLVPERVERLELGDASLRAVVEGRRGGPPHLVKAVTHHGLEFRRANGRWRARAVLDV